MSYQHDKKWATNGKYWNLPDIKINGLVLHSIGTPQPKADVFVKSFNSPSASASVHGFIEPGRYVETAPQFEKRGVAKKCYHVGGDWNSTRIGIEMTEPNTIKYTGGASFTDLDPAATKDFILRNTQTAAEVFADLCIFHGIPSARISTHAEAHRLGHGSNHADPEHLWRHIGYSLDQFQKDVQAFIDQKTGKGDVLKTMTQAELEKTLAKNNENILTKMNKQIEDATQRTLDAALEDVHKAILESQPEIFTTIEDVPEWAKPTISKCIAHGLLKGTGDNNLNLSYDLTRTLVILDRAGVLD